MPGLLHECKGENFIWRIQGGTLPIGGRPLIMGILNVTPDSFYDGGRYFDQERAVRQGLKLVEEGADLLDVGGLSTRPGSRPIPWEEEADRILPVISSLSSRTPVPISVDTYRAPVAQVALEAGARIVNDVGALRLDPEMASVVRDSGSGLVLMHMRGTPQTMQEDTHYDFLLDEIHRYFEERLAAARAAGIGREQILIDPGIGFGKSFEQNLEILRNLEFFQGLEHPILVGPSRKSFIGRVLERPPEERLLGTLACVAACCYHGAAMIRVHDVRETREFLKMLEAVEGI